MCVCEFKRGTRSTTQRWQTTAVMQKREQAHTHTHNGWCLAAHDGIASFGAGTDTPSWSSPGEEEDEDERFGVVGGNTSSSLESSFASFVAECCPASLVDGDSSDSDSPMLSLCIMSMDGIVSSLTLSNSPSESSRSSWSTSSAPWISSAQYGVVAAFSSIL